MLQKTLKKRRRQEPRSTGRKLMGQWNRRHHSKPATHHWCRRRKKQIRSVQSHFAVFRERSVRLRMRPPASDGEMVLSSTKITPPCFRCCSTQVLSSRGIGLRSYLTSVKP